MPELVVAAVLEQRRSKSEVARTVSGFEHYPEPRGLLPNRLHVDLRCDE